MKPDVSQLDNDNPPVAAALAEAEVAATAGEGHVRKNIIANYVGRFSVALCIVAFIPVYRKLLGIEAFGLIGFYMTLQAVFFLLDMGLSTTLNRELARRSVRDNAAQEMRDLTRTLEVFYWVAAIVAGIAVVLLSPVLAHWVNAKHLSIGVIRTAVVGMGIAAALQFPFGLYQGGLLGLQRQVLLNVVLVVMTVLRYVGAAVVLWLVSPTIQAYFAWQVFVSGLQSLATALVLWRALPKSSSRAVFRKSLLVEVWRFAAGLAGISVSAALLTQTDKIVLSKVIPLSEFGYYTLASTVAAGLVLIISPVFTALLPRFSQLVATDDEAGLARLYHKASQLMSVAVLPVAAVLAMFSYEVLHVWTHNPIDANRAHLVLTLLIIGTAMNGMVTVPYSLQLAYGWTRLTLYSNTIAVALLVPTVIFAARKFGAPGAAAVWILLNVGYLFVYMQIMHRRLLPKEKLRWYFIDLALPAVAAVGVAAVGRLLVPHGLSPGLSLVSVAGVLLFSTVAACLAAPYSRAWMLGKAGIRKS